MTSENFEEILQLIKDNATIPFDSNNISVCFDYIINCSTSLFFKVFLGYLRQVFNLRILTVFKKYIALFLNSSKKIHCTFFELVNKSWRNEEFFSKNFEIVSTWETFTESFNNLRRHFKVTWNFLVTFTLVNITIL